MQETEPGVRLAPKLVKIPNPKVSVKCSNGECSSNPVIVEHCFLTGKTKRFIREQEKQLAIE